MNRRYTMIKQIDCAKTFVRIMYSLGLLSRSWQIVFLFLRIDEACMRAKQ